MANSVSGTFARDVNALSRAAFEKLVERKQMAVLKNGGKERFTDSVGIHGARQDLQTHSGKGRTVISDIGNMSVTCVLSLQQQSRVAVMETIWLTEP